jgi:hypothetical protein
MGSGAAVTPVTQLVKLVGIDVCESENLTMEWEMSFDSALNGEIVERLGAGTGAHNLWTHECRGWT